MIPTNRQIRYLKSLSHDLSPVVRIGQKGLTDAVSKELESALAHHELIKIKVSGSERDDRRKMVQSIASDHKAMVIQEIGHTAVLFRRNANKPAIDFSSIRDTNK